MSIPSIQQSGHEDYSSVLTCADVHAHRFISSLVEHALELERSLCSDIETHQEGAIKSYQSWLETASQLTSKKIDENSNFLKRKKWQQVCIGFVNLQTDAAKDSIEWMADSREKSMQGTVTQLLSLIENALEIQRSLLPLLRRDDLWRQRAFLSRIESAVEQFSHRSEVRVRQRRLKTWEALSGIKTSANQTSLSLQTQIASKMGPVGALVEKFEELTLEKND